MAMKVYSTFSKAPDRDLYHQIQLSVISRILIGLGSFFSAEMQLAYFTAPDDWSILENVLSCSLGVEKLFLANHGDACLSESARKKSGDKQGVMIGIDSSLLGRFDTRSFSKPMLSRTQADRQKSA